MQDIQKIVGERIRNYRISAGISQEKLAEEASVHATYIGQVERGEKNVTLKSLAKITAALHVSLSEILDGVDVVDTPRSGENFPLLCETLVAQESIARQKELYAILKSVTAYGK